MAGNLKGLKIVPKKRSKETNPLKIFESLTLRGTIENIWEPQSEALKAWDAVRAKPDVVVEMNTGGGKTLIGLLICQSIVNETSGKVVFVCPTIQLIEQAKMRAEECGLDVATYYDGNWENKEVFTGATGPCLTTYAALFNGKSIFRKEDIQAYVLDDAHVAGPSVRNSFTLKLPAGTDAYEEIIKLFKPYIDKSGHGQELDALRNGDWMPLLFIPAFEINRQAQLLTKILTDNDVDEDKGTLFAWEHLRDRIGRCAVLISSRGIEISPVSLPMSTLRYFSDGPRRIYLTATMPSPVQFAQTFGVSNAEILKPGGKSGDSQRLFVFAHGKTDEEQRAWTKSILEKYKACVITPMKKQVNEWTDVATFYDGGGQAAVETFKKAKAPTKMVMAARYDGVDLPGDACRTLVIDGIPRGNFAIERFSDEILNLKVARTGTTAVRLTQAIGRIFRSNTDHGVVILCGSELQNWVRSPLHQTFLPDLLQRQLQFGIQLAEMVENGETTYEDLIEGVLKGDRDWDRLYKSTIGGYDTETLQTPPAWLLEAAEKESAAFLPLWQGDYPGAANALRSVANSVAEADPKLASWYSHWCGLAHEMAGQQVPAMKSFQQAANRCAVLGRPTVNAKSVMTSAGSPTASPQAHKIAGLMTKPGSAQKLAASIKEGLQYGDKTNPVEEALSNLGKLLGLEASRPDNQTGPKKTGPDVLWRYEPAKAGVALEAKTNKKPGSEYQKKDDIGQFHDHVAYLKKHHEGETFYQAIVGRRLPVSQESHPPEELRIVPLEGFQQLAGQVEAMINYVEASPDNDPVSVKVEKWLQFLGLAWPECFDGLPFQLASDLKRGDAQPEQVL